MFHFQLINKWFNDETISNGRQNFQEIFMVLLGVGKKWKPSHKNLFFNINCNETLGFGILKEFNTTLISMSNRWSAPPQSNMASRGSNKVFSNKLAPSTVGEYFTYHCDLFLKNKMDNSSNEQSGSSRKKKKSVNNVAKAHMER